LTWQTVFQTTDRSEVERYCRTADIDLTWLPGDRLQTRQVCQAVATHPETGASVWFIQAHLFHISGLTPADRAALLAVVDEAALPRNAYWGDGAPIDDETLAHIRDAYEREKVVFPWQTGDVLLLDNTLVAHGRAPFAGPRTVLVGMTGPYAADRAGPGGEQ
jgi:alpha-ketoglutarate-dependent taurine dioxygenase